MEQTQIGQDQSAVAESAVEQTSDAANLAANLGEAQCFDKRLAATVLDAVNAAKTGRLTNVTRERKAQVAPLLYALPSLQRDVSKQLGVTVKKVLDIAQNLYEKHKAISYPRSECEYLPLSQFDQSAALLSQLGERQPHYKAWLPLCDANKKGRVWNDKKVAEASHHAIVPTLNSQVKIDNMTTDERYVYDLIVRRYFMQFMPDAQYDTAQFVADFAGHVFVANGRVLVQQGWLCAEKSAVEAKPADKKSAAQGQDVEAISLPHLQQGQTLSLIQANIQPNKTKPPSPYTESTLLAAMENVSRFVTDKEIKKWLKDTAGLGTPATRGDIIETLKRREYVDIDKKSLRSTEKGAALIASLRVVSPALTDPVMTARWEMALDDIAAGRMTLPDFIQFQGKFVTAMVTAIKTAPVDKLTWAAPSAQPTSKSTVNSSPKVRSAVRSAPTGLATTKPKEPPTGVTCSLCGQPMVKRQGSRGAFLACSAYPTCKNTRNL
jgi:DNA topoisomerase-3